MGNVAGKISQSVFAVGFVGEGVNVLDILGVTVGVFVEDTDILGVDVGVSVNDGVKVLDMLGVTVKLHVADGVGLIELVTVGEGVGHMPETLIVPRMCACSSH